MTVTDIAEEVQTQLVSAVQVVQESVVTTLEWISEKAETLLPDAASRFAARLPQATHYVDRGFETAESWLRSQHDFAAKVAGAIQPSDLQTSV